MNKSIIITGASSGIGAVTADLFLDAGWQVGLIARRKAALVKVAAGREHAHVLVADVTNETAMARAFSKFVQNVGRLDVLFNNAGILGAAGLIDEISVADWRSIVDVNLTGMFIAARCAFAQMRNQDPIGGRIINNGSVAAHVPRPNSVGYTTTKHAISGLTKTLSVDGRAFDIACGQIDIGNAETELLRDLNARALAANPDMEIQPMMDVRHAALAVKQMAELPLSANVQTMTIMATKMPFIGRG